MSLTLIPVIEIGYNNQGIQSPQQYPYWEYPDLWDEYNSACHLKAGFKENLIPYLPGLTFYKLADISMNNLKKIVTDHVADFIKGAYSRDQAEPLSGGYLLSLNGVAVFCPQCCSDLWDLPFWENLLDDNVTFSPGHPTPDIIFSESHITFSFETDEFSEHFAPPPPFSSVTIEKTALKQALEVLRAELIDFSEIIKSINISEQLNIPGIDKLLIWGDDYVPR